MSCKNWRDTFQSYWVKKYGFFLMVYEHDSEKGRSNYISNSNREDVIQAMKEFIEKTEDSF